MNAAHDVDLARSRVARVEGTPAGLVFLAIRGDRGWIGGMGVVREGRGHGLGRRLMDAALEQAREAGLASVQLEVIEENRSAISIYEAAGFRTTRRLEVLARAPGPPPGLASAGVVAVPAAAWLATLAARPAPARPWQREPVMLERAADLAVLAAAGPDGRPRGGLAFRADGARAAILDLAGDPAAIEAAVHAAIERHPAIPFTLLNLPAEDPARAALLRLGFDVRFVQREMRWTAA